jgi:type II secretory pathway predicted ATPase ExeA
MLFDFYGLREQPFGVTPDPRFLYLSASHREALASLSYSVKMNRGLVALVAPPGMGKTTLLFRLLEHLQQSARTAFLFQTQCDSKGLLQYILNDLGINTRGQSFIDMHQQLNSLLVGEARAGRRFVVVIDEAQNLDEEVLETARLLTDFETPNQKLLQIVIAGQPQLADKLKRPELIQLRQRISTVGRLGALRLHEVNEYINRRLQVASCAATPIFTPAAVCKIYSVSEGVPRNINNLCFNAMSLGYALHSKTIDADLVGEAAADLDLELPTDPLFRPLLPVRDIQAGGEKRVDCPDDLHTPSISMLALYPKISTRQADEGSGGRGSHKTRREEDCSVADRVGSCLVLERLERAIERNAEILAEVVDDTHVEVREAAAPDSEEPLAATPTSALTHTVTSSSSLQHPETYQAEPALRDIPFRKSRRKLTNLLSIRWKATRGKFAKSTALSIALVAVLSFGVKIGNVAFEIREIVTERVLHVVLSTCSINTTGPTSEKQSPSGTPKPTHSGSTGSNP